MSEQIGFSFAQLQYFVAAAETKTISAAAKRLRVSQSTLSSAILRLEEQLETQLFLRQRARGIVLTANGRRLLSKTREMIRSARDLQQYSRQAQEEVVGHLDVGCFTTIAPLLVPSLVQRLHERHPRLSVRVRETDIDPLYRLLGEGVCELALTYDLGLTDQLVFTELVELRPHALVAQTHPLARVGRARLAELGTEPFIMLDLPHPRRFQEYLLGQAGLKPPSVVRTTSFETMRGLVAAGVGFAICNQRVATAVTYDDGRVAPVEIIDEVPTIRMGVATMTDARHSRRSHALLEALRWVVAQTYPELPTTPLRPRAGLAPR